MRHFTADGVSLFTEYRQKEKGTAMPTRRQVLLASLAAFLPVPLLAQTCVSAADISGAGPWFNSSPLKLAQLKNKVVLVEFWTHGCYNCRNVEPYIKLWHERYADQDLVVVGVHTPEFVFEADPKRVQAYLTERHIAYPVVMDNDHAIWDHWNNQYWPAIYLVNKAGQVCYSHFGEGAYAQTEQKIRELLANKR
jgi:thiol-disulfide isomerase/thioredoxin